MRPGQENLIKKSDRTPEERRESARNAGKASGAARRKKRDAKKLVRQLLEMSITGGKVTSPEDVQSLAEMGGKNITALDAIILKQIQVAMSGDLKAARFLLELLDAGDKEPAAKREQKARVDKMKAETERVKQDTIYRSGAGGIDESLAQAEAIADMINTPEAERVLSDYLNPEPKTDDETEDE